MDDDAAQVRQALAGDEAAFAAIVRRHERLVWHIVQRLVRDTEDARELCQETFLRVHRRLHQFRGESSLRSWIGSVAWSIALRHLERRRVRLVEAVGDDDATLVDSMPDPFDLEAAFAAAQLRERLHAAIESLAPLPRTLLTLYHLEELPIAEIEDITGVPAGTIKSHLSRARLKLRGVLAPLLKEL